MMVADARYCNNDYGKIICTVTWDYKKGPCDGDSGGPLACLEQDGNWYLRGVFSHGEEKCRFWAVFTKVASYENWINLMVFSK